MWPFTRKPKPINPGPINEDWQVGDLAQSIGNDGWDGDGIGPEDGDVCKVLGVGPGRNQTAGDGWYFTLNGFPGRFCADHFRKVPPLNTEASAEFTAKIRACKPAHRKAPTSC